MSRFALTAPEVVARLHPNSASIGSISAPVEDRNPAAATSAASTPSATHQARWIRGRVRVGTLTREP